MRTFDSAGRVSTSLPLVADDITELHAARLLLLLKHCGHEGTINGLTKLAKLDFFVDKYMGAELEKFIGLTMKQFREKGSDVGLFIYPFWIFT